MKAKVSFKQLQAVEAVSRHGSFTLAARELGVSQPTVSNLIYTLERQYSCRLLDRSGTSITPTPQLMEIGGHIKSVLSLTDAISNHLSSGRDLLSGRFTVGYTTYQLSMPIIANFVRAYPSLDVRASDGAANELLNGIRNGDYDAVFVTAQSLPADLDGTEICSTRVGLAVPKSHPVAKQGRIPWAQLTNLPLVQRMQGSGTQQIFDAAANRAGARLNRTLELGSWGSALSVVRQDLGFAIALEPECVDEDDITFIDIADTTLGAKHFLVCQQALRETAPIRRFMETANAHAGKPPQIAARL